MRTLDLSYNGLGKEGAVALEEALKHNNTLEDLNIRYCRHSMVIYHNCIYGLQDVRLSSLILFFMCTQTAVLIYCRNYEMVDC